MRPHQPFFIMASYIVMEAVHLCKAQTYNQTRAIFTDKLGPDKYNIQVRPVKNQSDIIYVNVLFETVSIVDVDDVSQSFSCNGFVLFSWKDELVVWDPANYGGQNIIVPLPTDIWRPRVGIMNTLDDRDPFKDEHSLLRVSSDGLVNWVPGSVFLCSCKLVLTKYPFDRQTCDIQLAALQNSASEVQFLPTLTTVGETFFTNNGEWELIGSEIVAFDKDIGLEILPILKISFQIKRRPTFFLINIVFPVILLSFLNILVFVIPVESGEKISYGITVQLALAVYLSIVSEMLPRVSETMPTVMIYLFVIFILSLLTVVDTMVIVFLHRKEQVEENHHQGKTTNSRSTSKQQMIPRNSIRPECTKIFRETILFEEITSMKSTESMESLNTKQARNTRNTYDSSYQTVPRTNKYKMIGKYIDLVSFSLFVSVWLTLTLGFLLDVSGVLSMN